MARILYSILGEGMGHTIRSSVIIDELIKNHDVEIVVASQRCYQVLKNKFSKVTNVEGLRLIYEDNRISEFKTIKYNFQMLTKHSIKNFKILYNIIMKFDPDIIITDFESNILYASEIFNIPVICLCNNHAISEMRYKVPKKYRKDYLKNLITVKAMSPNIKYHLITTFFDLPVKKKNVFLFPPILRKEILMTKPGSKEHILVYQTSSSNTQLLKELKSIDEKFLVYGFNKKSVENNLHFREFDEKIFIKDLKDCKACIANGGFTVLTEAFYLNKPVLSIPIRGQFEQILNALQLERLGFGELQQNPTRKSIREFIGKCDAYAQNLKSVKKEDSHRIIEKIEKIIDYEKSNRKKRNIKSINNVWKILRKKIRK